MENSSNDFDAVKYSKGICDYLSESAARHVQKLRSTVKWVGTSSEGLRISINGFLKACELHGVAVENREIDLARFDLWYAEKDYAKRFPQFGKAYPNEDMRKKKALEHWLTLDAVEGHVDSLIDVSGGASPFCELARDEYGASVKAYHLEAPQDELGVKPGVSGEVIGASPDDIPLPDGSISLICAHNAVERFDGESYFGFFKEAERLLKPNGEVFVAPLFVARRTYVLTAMNAIFKNLNFPRYLRSIPVVLDESIRQPYVLRIDGRHLREKVVDLSPNMDYRVIFFENWEKANIGFPLVLLGRKN